MLTKSSDRIATHAGHLYVNGVHWLYKCPKCITLMAQADAIAKEHIDCLCDNCRNRKPAYVVTIGVADQIAKESDEN